MNRKKIHTILTLLIALVWVINGLLCKILDIVPRHEQIVARILGNEFASPLTKAIGFAEICMAVWILSRYRPRLCAWAQILTVTSMNAIEFVLAPDLLLWGRANAIFAFVFVYLVYYNEFLLAQELRQRI